PRDSFPSRSLTISTPPPTLLLIYPLSLHDALPILKRVEGRMRAVENAVRAADEHEWERTNPRVRARAEGAAAQLEDAIAGLQEDLAKAQSSGDSAKIARAEEALAARRAWLEQVQRAAQDTR